jgi:hypothetical protein
MTAKKILDELTPEQERLMDEVAEEYVRDMIVPREPDMDVIRKWLTIAYGLYDLKLPDRIEIAGSPYAALKLASDLTGEKQTYMDWCGTGDAGWVSFYDYFSRIGILSSDESGDLLALREFGKVAWDSVLLDECAIAIRRPSLHVDEDGRLHSSTGPCVAWYDVETEYAWHGTWVPERIILDPRSHTVAEFQAIANTEHRRALCESAGWDWVAKLLGAVSISEYTDPVTGLAYSLERCSDGVLLLKQQSPPLKDGSQPYYYEPVDRSLTTAAGARKWQATALDPGSCDKDPSLSYESES